MSADDGRVTLKTVASGVPGLDVVLGGGLPEYSFNLIAGEPGAGKTTLAQQIAFASAREGRHTLYFTVLGEPTLKMLRYQQQYAFFDRSLVGHQVHFVNLAEDVVKGDLDAVLERIGAEVGRLSPAIVVVDSFRTVGSTTASVVTRELETFVQRLALRLTTWEVTSFLIGEYTLDEARHPVFTVADGILWLSAQTQENASVRKIQVVKMRGRATLPGLHTFRITGDGVEVFPRTAVPQRTAVFSPDERVRTGLPALDAMLGGGLPRATTALLTGPSGSGKTTFAVQFLAEAARLRERAVVAVVEEHPLDYAARARRLGVDLDALAAEGWIDLLYLRPVDLSVEETLHEIVARVQRAGASRVLIDSLSGLEFVLAPEYRRDFRHALYRLATTVTSLGATLLVTLEASRREGEARRVDLSASFLADVVIAQRDVIVDGEPRTALVVQKVRGSAHERRLRSYAVTADGVSFGAYLTSTTAPEAFRPSTAPAVGLTPAEDAVRQVLDALGEGTIDDLARLTRRGPADLGSTLARLSALGLAADGATPGLWRSTAPRS